MCVHEKKEDSQTESNIWQSHTHTHNEIIKVTSWNNTLDKMQLEQIIIVLDT